MALKKCKECGNDVSTKAVSCPKCGVILKKKMGCIGCIGTGFLILVIIGVIGSLMVNDSPKTTRSSVSLQPKSKPEAKKGRVRRQVSSQSKSLAGNVNAEIKVDKSKVCEFLVDIGYPTHGWRYYSAFDDYGCTSPSKEIGFSGPVWAPALKNNLAYIVSGTATKVSELRLIVNINNSAEANTAHEELLRATALLVKKSLNEPLPENIREAIIEGKDISSKIGDANIRVVRNDWSTGKGYDIKVIIR